MTELETALALLKASEQDRKVAQTTANRDERQLKAATQLYNAASAYAALQDISGSGDWDMALKFSNNLEEAARYFVFVENYR